MSVRKRNRNVYAYSGDKLFHYWVEQPDLYVIVRCGSFDFSAGCVIDRDLKRTEDLANWLESAYSYLAMVDYPNPSEFLMPLPGHPIKEVSWDFHLFRIFNNWYKFSHAYVYKILYIVNLYLKAQISNRGNL